MGVTNMISVVIPVLEGETELTPLFESLNFEFIGELIFVVGQGSVRKKDVPVVASINEQISNGFPRPVNIIFSGKGKSIQLNHGCAEAKHDLIWCLHADSGLRIRPSFNPKILKSVLFYGGLRFSGGSPLMGLNEIGVYFRCLLWGMPFGDQGFLFSKEIYNLIGGFDESISLGESHHFAWKCKDKGIPVKKGAYTVITSARKYLEHGWLKTTLFHVSETFRQMKKFQK